MLQRLDVPIQSLTTETTTLHTDYFPSIVSALKKCKNSLENDRRLENFNWRLWRRGSTQSTTSTASLGETWSNCSYTSSPSSSSSFSLASHPSTMIDASSTETAMIETTGLTSSCSDITKHQQQPKFFVADVENNHADYQRIQSPPPADDYTPQKQNQNHAIPEDDDDDESTLFGDENEEIENNDQGTADVLSHTYWPCYEFTKKQAPSVDHHQRSLLSSMLLHESGSSSVSSKMNSSSPISLTKNYSAPSTATSLLTSWVDNNVLSSSMKQHVDWEKLQNRGPAAGLMGISKNVQGTHPASSMTLVSDTLDTFTGCW